ncbi:hypothetical protein NLJ89_g445 [Agrocybe chaxingu]|uniref:N-acetyltransferase domain-containing protein n=1 Tax=Agrocybe chaxingu TaxID=84603 RepID=A0A9W8N1W7_9AGAR|nr:hypothetical protein NLJ89_g445 [Agrocybe chaxingu]
MAETRPNAKPVGDPFTDILTGGDLSLSRPQFNAMLRGALIGGQVYVISIGPNPTDIVGVTVWYPPGKHSMSTDEERAQGWNQFMESLPEKLRTWFAEHFRPRMSGLAIEALGEEQALNAWHLQLFGVLKVYHGKGYGRKLYEVVERQAKAQGAVMYLETTTELDVKIYQKLGFHVRSEVHIINWIGTGHVRLMIQETKESNVKETIL